MESSCHSGCFYQRIASEDKHFCSIHETARLQFIVFSLNEHRITEREKAIFFFYGGFISVHHDFSA